MLPDILCEELCSLVPNADRLAFSVVWKMDDQAEVKDVWFGKSVINSCAKLSYEHAQASPSLPFGLAISIELFKEIIDQPTKEYTKEEFAAISPSKTFEDVRDSVLSLHLIAQKLKQKRLENGALRLDQPKMKFSLEEKKDSSSEPHNKSDRVMLPSGVALDIVSDIRNHRSNQP